MKNLNLFSLLLLSPILSPILTAAQSINPGAVQGMASQVMGAGVNATMGAMFMEQCSSQNRLACVMGALTIGQAGITAMAAGQSGATAEASKFGPTNLPKISGDPFNPASVTGPNADVVRAGFETLKAEGIKASSNGVTMPDGTFLPPSTFSSPAKMAAAGFSAKSIQDTQNIIAAVNASTKDVAAGKSAKVSGGGLALDGAGGAQDSSDNNKAELSGRHFINPFALKPEQKNQMVVGKTVLFDGEPIGVRGLNIFEMVHVAYKKKRENNNFIENTNAVPVRAPASSPLN